MPGSLLYLDSSAIVKLVLPEPETKSLLSLLGAWPERVTSVVARVEVERVARRAGGGALRRSGTVLSRVGLVELDGEAIERAAILDPPILRTLDAIHLATALSLGRDLGAVAAYDHRLASAAVAKGLRVLAPS